MRDLGDRGAARSPRLERVGVAVAREDEPDRRGRAQPAATDGLVDDADEPPRDAVLFLDAHAVSAAGSGSGRPRGDREAMRPERRQERAELRPVRERAELLERVGDDLLVDARPHVQLAEVPAVERDRHVYRRRRIRRLRGRRDVTVPAGEMTRARTSRSGGLPRR